MPKNIFSSLTQRISQAYAKNNKPDTKNLLADNSVNVASELNTNNQPNENYLADNATTNQQTSNQQASNNQVTSIKQPTNTNTNADDDAFAQLLAQLKKQNSDQLTTSTSPTETEPLKKQGKTFGINGFGRIGRTAFRIWWQKHQQQLNLKLINTSGSMDLNAWAHLLKYDSNYGPFQESIIVKQTQTLDQISDENPVLGTIIIANKEITFTAQRDPKKIPWAKYGVETVLESTGAFNKEDKALWHLEAGAKNVLLSAPGKKGNIDTSVIGVNHFQGSGPIYSNASCTTNCIAPVVKIILEQFGIKKATMTTIHAYTDDQNLQDNSHKKDLRRARTAGINMIPTTTGAAKATTQIIPELKDKFDGLAVRVPTAVGSLADMVFVLERSTTKEEVNQVLTQASETVYKNILATTNEPIVSSDIVARNESSIVDLSLTQVVDGDLLKVVSWYDNEWGYCCRLLEQLYQI